MVATITQGMSEVVCLPPYNQRTVYSESEETHEDHQLQLLAPHRTTQKSNPVSESVVQMLLELWLLEVGPLHFKTWNVWTLPLTNPSRISVHKVCRLWGVHEVIVSLDLMHL